MRCPVAAEDGRHEHLRPRPRRLARRLVLGPGRRPLREAGHDVHAPTLTGLSERAHLLSPLVGLDTHVEDVVRLIDVLGLTDVVLVGHSYAGQIVTAVADRRPRGDRAARLPRRLRRRRRRGGPGPAARDRGAPLGGVGGRAGLRLAGAGPQALGARRDRAGRRRLAAAEADAAPLEDLHRSAAADRRRRRRARRRSSSASAGCGCSPARPTGPARAGWPVHELETGHEAMVTAPEELADVLLELAAKRPAAEQEV